MLQQAKVIGLKENHTARIEVLRASACGHDCSSCGGCGMQAAPIRTFARNRIGASVGDTVTVETKTSKIIGIAGVVYLLPILLFLVTYFIVHAIITSDTMAFLGGCVGFMTGFFIASLLNLRIAKQGDIEFEIVAIENEDH